MQVMTDQTSCHTIDNTFISRSAIKSPHYERHFLSVEEAQVHFFPILSLLTLSSSPAFMEVKALHFHYY